MTSTPAVPIPALSGWALILGASSGFGAAVASVLARAGCHIIGVHLDRRATGAQVERIQTEINAADAAKRGETLGEIARRFADRKQDESIRVVLHSLAFGSLRSFIAEGDEALSGKQLEMTVDVMAHSLVYWTQDLVRLDLLRREARIFAMTSTGSWAVWKGYGAVGAAKAALEAHVRQLAVELGPRGITANAICAGVTETPALLKIPNHEEMVAVALRKNPFHRLTHPEDVANAIAALAQPSTYWLNGNVINVDGGEAASG
jgi:NAD(P)-dependent dehydrogenase (short-subunit alcohol dehydrogenase family)